MNTIKLLTLITLYLVCNVIYAASDPKKELFISQPIKHGDIQPGKYNQRYFVDDTYKKSNTSPIILSLCGEWECGPFGKSKFLRVIAKEVGATIISLEHRYYGKSHPYETLALENLKHLSVKEALNDIETFQEDFDPGIKRQWFITGISYAGTLAAFYRQQNPQKVIGAWADSSPIKATFAFYRYDNFVVDKLGDKCFEGIRSDFSKVEKDYLEGKSIEQYKNLFSKLEYIDGDENFLFLLGEITVGLVQFGKRSELCQKVLELGGIQAVAHVSSKIKKYYDLSEWGFSTVDDISISNEKMTRQWWYQVCYEMGFFQVTNTNPKKALRSSIFTADFYQNLCSEKFNIAGTKIDEFNLKYYRPLKEGDYSRIIFTTGTEDPWTKLSITPKTLVKGEDSIIELIEGIGHGWASSKSKDLGILKVQRMIPKSTS